MAPAARALIFGSPGDLSALAMAQVTAELIAASATYDQLYEVIKAMRDGKTTPSERARFGLVLRDILKDTHRIWSRHLSAGDRAEIDLFVAANGDSTDDDKIYVVLGSLDSLVTQKHGANYELVWQNAMHARNFVVEKYLDARLLASERQEAMQEMLGKRVTDANVTALLSEAASLCVQLKIGSVEADTFLQGVIKQALKGGGVTDPLAISLMGPMHASATPQTASSVFAVAKALERLAPSGCVPMASGIMVAAPAPPVMKPPQGGGGENGPLTCGNCDQPGHVREACQMPLVTCPKCGRKGHSEARCRQESAPVPPEVVAPVAVRSVTFVDARPPVGGANQVRTVYIRPAQAAAVIENDLGVSACGKTLVDTGAQLGVVDPETLGALAAVRVTAPGDCAVQGAVEKVDASHAGVLSMPFESDAGDATVVVGAVLVVAGVKEGFVNPLMVASGIDGGPVEGFLSIFEEEGRKVGHAEFDSVGVTAHFATGDVSWDVIAAAGERSNLVDALVQGVSAGDDRLVAVGIGDAPAPAEGMDEETAMAGIY